MPDVRIVEVDTGVKSTFKFDAECDDSGRCGLIEVTRMRARIDGKVAWGVQRIDVDVFQRRLGIATKLYEAAAAEACRRRGHLASTSTGRIVGAYSNAFWAKQVAKGRAVAGRRTRRVDGSVTTAYILPDCPPPSLAGVKRRRR